MQTEEIIQKIRKEVESFNDLCKKYLIVKQEIENIKLRKNEMEKKLQELKPIEQRKQEFLYEVWHIEAGETSTDKLLKEINQLEGRIQELQKQKDDLRGKILESLVNLAFPLDPNSVRKEGNYYCIHSIEGVDLAKESYSVISEILDLSFPLKIDKVIAGPNEWKVQVNSQEEALKEIISAIKTIREQAKFRRRAFSELDAFCRRIHKSDRYRQVMLLLASQRKVSPKEVAAKLGLEERVAYDACYNLTRSTLWNPPLVKKEDNGFFTITTFGSLVMQRYMEIYGSTLKTAEKLTTQTTLGEGYGKE
jgi:DNA repair exonuclease SbcCD ATPase subunit